jgi:predicted transposase YdaD
MLHPDEICRCTPVSVEGGIYEQQHLASLGYVDTELVARNRSDLLELGQFCAGLVFKDEFGKQWLEERFKNVQEIIESSWVYQETLEKGRKEGHKEGGQQALQATANRIVAARFPALEQLAKEIIETIKDLDQLQMLVVELSIASSQEHAKQLLLSHVSGA